MSMCNCSCKSRCSVIGIIASVIVGLVAAILRISAVITVTPAFLWVVLGIAVVYLALSLVFADNIKGINKSGFCPILSVFFTGILGSILMSVVLLGVTFVATSTIGAILTGALFAFASLIFTQTVCLVKCLVNCDNE